MSSLGSVLRALSLLLMSGLLLLAATTARAITDGARSMTDSDVAFDRGELRTSILHARRAATLYAPGAPHVGHAYERLRAIALGSEASGQPQLAYLAWQAMRSLARRCCAWCPTDRKTPWRRESSAKIPCRPFP